MVNQSTTDKLIEMRLTAMADAFRIQLDDKSMKEIPFEDRFGMLVDIEYTSRKNNRLKRLIRNAELEQSDACIAGIDYTSGRKLNKSLINRLATCEYITEYRNIFISGATGSGKTYMACAFGLEACKQYYTVKYIRLPDLLLDLEVARSEGAFAKALSKYTKPLLLIIDEWLLLKLNESESKNLFELINKLLYGNNASGKSTMMNIMANKLQIKGQEYATSNQYGIIHYFTKFIDECSYTLGEDEDGRQIGRLPRRSRYIKSEDILYEIKKIQL